MAPAGASGSTASPRGRPQTRFARRTSRPPSDPRPTWAAARCYWHEVIGVTVAGLDGAELGVVQDIYRVAENEVYVVGGGAYGTFDLPAVRAFIRIFAPRRGEIVVDAEALDLRPRANDARTQIGRAPRDGRLASGSPRPRHPARLVRSGPRGPATRRRVMTLEIDVLTLFPAMIEGPLSQSIPGRIQEQGLATIRVHDLRDFGLGRHKSVDDAPYGGGAGMVMRVEPVVAAIESVRRPGIDRHPPRPGRRGVPPRARGRPRRPGHLVFVCPRYEGVDERIRGFVDLELSIGDYVVTGGELPALVVIDAVIRLLPGAIDDLSTAEESFSEGLLEYPQYTRPPSFRGLDVPEILTSGDHGAVARWRARPGARAHPQSRPDLPPDDA